MYKTPECRSKFGSWDVEKVHAVVARSTFRSQKCQKTDGFGALLDVHMSFCVAGLRDYAPGQKWAKRDGFVAFSTTTTTTPHYTQLHSITRHYITLHYTPLHTTTLHYTELHYTIHYTPPHYTTLHYTTLHCTTLHYTRRPSTTLHYITLHYITLNDTAPHIDG